MTLQIPPSGLESALVSLMNNPDNKMREFNDKIRELVEYTYAKFPDGCPFPQCRKDCILYHPDNCTSRDIFCWFLAEIGQRTVLDLNSTEPQQIYR